MKILWIQDLDPFSNQGGAQKTDKEIVIEGIRRGHNVDVLLPRGEFPEPREYDLAVVSNATTFPKDKLEKVKPAVWYLHDYYPLCHWRLNFPMQEFCMNCPNREEASLLLERAELIIWMSPLHRRSMLSVLPGLEEHPYALVPSAIDFSRFHTDNGIHAKPFTVIGVNSLLPFKGQTTILTFASDHGELHFDFVGSEKPPNLPSNCSVLGSISTKELTKAYQEHESFVHLPETPQPCERTPAEFLYCNPNGKLITNRNVGLLSYPGIVEDGKLHSERIFDLVTTSTKKFWEAVEKCAS